jgi:hypothetical protein
MKKLFYFAAIIFVSCSTNQLYLYTDINGCEIYDSIRNTTRKGSLVENADSVLLSNKWHLLYTIEKSALSKKATIFDSSIIVGFIDSTRIALTQTMNLGQQAVNDTINLILNESTNGIIYEKFYMKPNLRMNDTSLYNCEILYLNSNVLFLRVIGISKEETVLILTKL